MCNRAKDNSNGFLISFPIRRDIFISHKTRRTERHWHCSMTQGLTRGLSIRHCQLVQCHECRDEMNDYESEKWSAKSLDIPFTIPFWWAMIAYILLYKQETNVPSILNIIYNVNFKKTKFVFRETSQLRVFKDIFKSKVHAFYDFCYIY